MADYKNGILKTFENNTMSLSCSAYVKVKDGIIVESFRKGMPRVYGDGWFNIYGSLRDGQQMSEEVGYGVLPVSSGSV